MKTIMIKDDVYNTLNEIKGNMSFSELLGKLAKNNSEEKKKALLRLAGSINNDDANRMFSGIKEVKENAKVRSFR